MEPTRKINILVDGFLRFFTIALKNMGMYSSAHALVQQSLDRAHKGLQEVFEHKSTFTVSISENRLLRDESTLDLKNPAILKLGEMLQERNIDSITLAKGVTLEGLSKFIQYLMQKPEDLKSRGGIAALLEKENIPYLKINEVKYGKITRSTEQVEDLVITNFLLGQIDSLGREPTLLLEDLKQNPDKFAVLMADALGPEEPGRGPGTGSGAGTGEGMGGGKNRAAFLFDQATERLKGLMAGKEDDWRILKKKLAQALIATRPDLKAALSKIAAEEPGQEAAFMSSLAGQLSGDAVIAALARQYTQEHKGIDALGELLRQYIPDPEERKRLVPLLKEKLIAGGMDEDTFQRLMADQSWEGMPPHQRAEFLLSQAHDWNESKLRQAKKTLEELLTMEAYQEAGGLYQGIFDGLLAPAWEARRAVVSTTFDLLKLAEDNPRLTAVYDSIPDLLVKRLKNEENISVLITLVDVLERMARHLLSKNRFPLGNNLLEGLHQKIKSPHTSEAVAQRIDLSLHSIADNKLMDTLIDMLTHEDMQQRKEAARALIVFRNLAVDPLVERLAEEQDMAGRARIVQMITSLGQEAVEALKTRLNDSRWYVVRNAVSILGHIEAKEAVDFMLAPLHHPDVRVRKETIRSLVKIGSDKAARIMIKALDDDHEEVVELALDALVALGTRSALPLILEIARGHSRFGEEAINLRKKAVVALGKMAHEPALPVLIEFIEKKGFIGMVHDEEIREAAVIALGLLGKPEAKETLKKAAKNDPKPSVREMAKRCLFNLERLTLHAEE